MAAGSKNSGFVFPSIITAIVILSFTGYAFLYMSGERRKRVDSKTETAGAFWLAEAGIERAKEVLRREFVEGAGDWAGSNILQNEYGYSADNDEFQLIFEDIPLGKGTYSVSIKNVSDGAGGSVNDEIIVRSSGIVNDRIRTVQAHIRAFNFSPAESTIIAVGMGSGRISGNITICGSVFIGGQNTSEDALVLDLGGMGGGGIYNYYKGISANLSSRIPALPKVQYQGESVSSLRASLRVQRGRISLDGNAAIGASGIVTEGLNKFKGPMDGVYVKEGEDGVSLSGSAAIYSDNSIGTISSTYDFPSAQSLEGEFSSGAMIINDNVTIDSGGITYDASLVSGDTVSNSIEHDGNTLTLNGKIYIAGDLTFAGGIPVNYSGKGTIMTSGRTDINAGLLTSAFPNNGLIVFSEQDIDINIGGDASYRELMGMFLSDTNVTLRTASLKIAGSIGGNDFTINNPASVYQVPGSSSLLFEHILTDTIQWQMLVGGWEVVE